MDETARALRRLYVLLLDIRANNNLKLKAQDAECQAVRQATDCQASG